MDDLTGRVAVITGGASGIGDAMAQRFGAEGMRLVLADVERSALDAAVERHQRDGVHVLGMQTDVSSSEQVEALAAAAYDRFGAVHVVCNNAGVVTRGLAWEQTLDDWTWVLGVDLWGVINGVRAFVPRMLAGGEQGHLVNTASIAGLLAFRGIGPYNVSKVGVVALSETLHHELADAGDTIGVSVLCPGQVPTRIGESARNRPATAPNDRLEPIPSPPPGSARPVEEVAGLVVDAIRRRRFWIVTHPEYVEWIERRTAGILDGFGVVRPPVL